MIIDILEKDYEAVYNSLFVVFVAWFVVIISMLIDLFFGIKKAKELGEVTTSEGYRRTINKATYYFSLMTFGFLMDIFNVISPYYFPKPLGSIPFVSVFVAIALVITEYKSVREKAEDKARRRTDQSFKEMIEIMKDKDEKVNEVLEHLKKQKIKEDEKGI